MANPMVDAYVGFVNQINEIDNKLGDTGSTGRATLNQVVRDNTPYVTEAQQLLGTVAQELDTTKQLVMARTLMLEVSKVLGPIVDAFIKANTVETPEELQATEEEKANLYAERSKLQKMAKQLHGVLEALLEGTPELADLPACPEGIRGATGPRGKMGRKIPGGFFYTVNGEEVGQLATADVAKIAGVTTSELRTTVETTFPDDLPDEWEVTVGKSIVHAVRDGSEADTTSDDESAESNGNFFDN